MNQKITIQIFCAINPSEDPNKVKTAVNNIFPEIELDVSETEISGKTNNFSILSQEKYYSQQFLLCLDLQRDLLHKKFVLLFFDSLLYPLLENFDCRFYHLVD